MKNIYKNMSKLSLPISTVLIVCSLLVTNFPFMAVHGQINTTSLVSTRNNFDLDSGNLTSGHSSTDYIQFGVPGLEPMTSCPSEIAIYVHGVGANPVQAQEQVDRTKLTLMTDHYNIPVIGFSWDSNTPFGDEGWNTAKKIADQNGPKLAHFLTDYMIACKQHHQDTKIRIVGHSLGARVVFSSLLNLDKSQTWINNGFKITSVDLLGAAINDDVPSRNTAVGRAIEDVVIKFFNLYDPRDVMLLAEYGPTEDHDALGLNGAQSVAHPSNYAEQDVESSKMQLQDASGIPQPECLDFVVPAGWILTRSGWTYTETDNHCGYMGFRDPFNLNSIVSDGAMRSVITSWQQ
jgi:esterase/lipase superfamily enzyme